MLALPAPEGMMARLGRFGCQGFWATLPTTDGDPAEGALVLKADRLHRGVVAALFGRAKAVTTKVVEQRDGRLAARYRLDAPPAEGWLGTIATATARLDLVPGTACRIEAKGDQVFVEVAFPLLSETEEKKIRNRIVQEVEDAASPWRIVRWTDPALRLLEEVQPKTVLRDDEFETVRVAVSEGYYEKPRRCTMDDLAGHFGLSKSAICHRISKVERVAIQSLMNVGPAARDLPGA